MRVMIRWVLIDLCALFFCANVACMLQEFQFMNLAGGLAAATTGWMLYRTP